MEEIFHGVPWWFLLNVNSYSALAFLLALKGLVFADFLIVISLLSLAWLLRYSTVLVGWAPFLSHSSYPARSSLSIAGLMAGV